jgi:hypothetical protein
MYIWKNALNHWIREHQNIKLLGTPYDIKAQKVSILSLIVDQSHSIIKKGVSPKYNVIWMISKQICNHSFVNFY